MFPFATILPRACLAAILLSPMAAFAANSAELPAPTGTVILTISGNVANKNTDKGAEFDLDMIKAMPSTTYETTTPWHEGATKFTGPLLADIISAAGASGDYATVEAIDGYSVEIPFGEISQGNPILAWLRNGQEMEPQDQGPLFIIYNYDSDPALATEDYYSRSVWSVRAIDVK
ncbi:MAG: oxidoreductase [Nitratireductor sp.]|nr:molybdopterin-dependent oxidoreductase [Nitratireductor sp.]MCB1451102.1 molybdopterin-dependent oxidoreductase [Nitratireductor sp.]